MFGNIHDLFKLSQINFLRREQPYRCTFISFNFTDVWHASQHIDTCLIVCDIYIYIYIYIYLSDSWCILRVIVYTYIYIYMCFFFISLSLYIYLSLSLYMYTYIYIYVYIYTYRRHMQFSPTPQSQVPKAPANLVGSLWWGPWSRVGSCLDPSPP